MRESDKVSYKYFVPKYICNIQAGHNIFLSLLFLYLFISYKYMLKSVLTANETVSVFVMSITK